MNSSFITSWPGCKYQVYLISDVDHFFIQTTPETYGPAEFVLTANTPNPFIKLMLTYSMVYKAKFLSEKSEYDQKIPYTADHPTAL